MTTSDIIEFGVTSYPERAAEALERSEDYRVLRRFVPAACDTNPVYGEVGPDAIRRGVFVDTETTGVDRSTAKILELAVVPFEYTTTGRIVRVLRTEAYTAFEHPGESIPPEITTLTGITDEDVLGQAFDDEELKRALYGSPLVFLSSTAALDSLDLRVGSPILRTADETIQREYPKLRPLVVAHQADFDRPLLERRFPDFARLPWACSRREVPWCELFPEMVAETVPAVLAGARRMFFTPHRALDDCMAMLHALAAPVPGSDHQAFADLFHSAQTVSYRVEAHETPFSVKDTLKARGYCGDRWQTDRCWYKDLKDKAEAQAEASWVESIGGTVERQTLTAFDRWRA